MDSRSGASQQPGPDEITCSYLPDYVQELVPDGVFQIVDCLGSQWSETTLARFWANPQMQIPIAPNATSCIQVAGTHTAQGVLPPEEGRAASILGPGAACQIQYSLCHAKSIAAWRTLTRMASGSRTSAATARESAPPQGARPEQQPPPPPQPRPGAPPDALPSFVEARQAEADARQKQQAAEVPPPPPRALFLSARRSPFRNVFEK